MEMSRWHVASLIAAGLTLAGCAGSDAELPTLEFLLEPVSTFDPPPAGHAAPMDLMLHGGRVWVADMLDSRVDYFGTDGRYMGSMGGPGGGPGELRQPSAIGSVDDLIWVLNAGAARIEYFTPDGEAVGTQPLPMSGGSILHMVRAGDDFFAANLDFQSPLLRFPVRLDGGFMDAESPVQIFGHEIVEAAETMSPGASQAQMLRLAVVGDRLWVLHMYLPLFAIYSLDGELVRTVTYPSLRDLRGARPGEPPEIPIAVEPMGSMDLFPVGDDVVYLVTQQNASTGAQRIVVADTDGNLLGIAVNDGPVALAIGVSDGDDLYAAGLDTRTGETRIHRLARRASAGT